MEKATNLINRYSYYDKFIDFVIFIKVDENCNLNCSFCYQGDKKLNRIDTKEKISKCLANLKYGIDKYLKIVNCEKYEYSTLGICFFGGEPTLNTEAIDIICDFIKNTYNEKEKERLFISFTTNGIIFNEKIKQTLKNMKKVNNNPVNILISSDNSKEVYDKNRKIIGSNKSGFEIVHQHIKEYKEFLYELNGKIGNNHVEVATVLATPDQMLNNPMYIQNKFKDLTRTGKLLYFFDSNDTEYINAAKKFLTKAYNNLIDKCSLKNKHFGLNDIIDGIFELNGKDTFVSECNRMMTIDGNGEINWCNHNKNFGNEILTQEELKEKTFNLSIDNSYFDCRKLHEKNGSLLKDQIRPEIWKKLIAKFDPNVPITKVNIESTNLNLYDFIKYMIGSTQSEEKEIYIKNPSDKIIALCDVLDIKISKEPLKSEEENIFFINENGDLFFDEIFKNDNEMILTNVKEKHFIWIHTPTLLKSVNKFFEEKIKEVENE